MAKTLDEFVESYGAVKVLKDNLKANIEVFCDRLSADDKESLLRMNMIMVRQCLRDFGAE